MLGASPEGFDLTVDDVDENFDRSHKFAEGLQSYFGRIQRNGQQHNILPAEAEWISDDDLKKFHQTTVGKRIPLMVNCSRPAAK